MADQIILPVQGLHRHPRNGFWRNFSNGNCFELKSYQHAVTSPVVCPAWWHHIRQATADVEKNGRLLIHSLYSLCFKPKSQGKFRPFIKKCTLCYYLCNFFLSFFSKVKEKFNFHHMNDYCFLILPPADRMNFWGNNFQAYFTNQMLLRKDTLITTYNSYVHV